MLCLHVASVQAGNMDASNPAGFSISDPGYIEQLIEKITPISQTCPRIQKEFDFIA
jgi:hypothetical protein